MPVLLAFVSMAGLVMAILGTGFWHLLSWAALSYPIYIMLKFGRKFFACKPNLCINYSSIPHFET
jgi:hypothetical protein